MKFIKSFSVLFSSLLLLSGCENHSDLALRAMQSYRSEVDAYEALLEINNTANSLNVYEALKVWAVRSEQAARLAMSAQESWSENLNTTYLSYVKTVQNERLKRVTELSITIPAYAESSANDYIERILNAQKMISEKVAVILNEKEDEFGKVALTLSIDTTIQNSPKIECVKIVGHSLKNAGESCVLLAREECSDNIDLSCLINELERLNSRVFFMFSENDCGTSNQANIRNAKFTRSSMNACKP